MMKRIMSNEKGAALVTALMLTLITLGIVMAMLYMITQSIKVSAATKRYQSVTEATYGGAELVAFEIIGAAWKNYSSAGGMSSALRTQYANIDLAVPVVNDCLTQKLSSPSANWSNCSAQQKSTNISLIKTQPDLTFLLKGATTGQHYKVYAKIVDTSSGNTDNSSLITDTADASGLISASGSAYNKLGGSQVVMQHIPYGYRIEVQGEPNANLSEKTNVTVLYAY